MGAEQAKALAKNTCQMPNCYQPRSYAIEQGMALFAQTVDEQRSSGQRLATYPAIIAMQAAHSLMARVMVAGPDPRDHELADMANSIADGLWGLAALAAQYGLSMRDLSVLAFNRGGGSLERIESGEI